MPITLHYSGRAKNWDALTNLLSAATAFSAERGWHFALYDDPLGIMDDVEDKDDPGYIEHDGPFRGISIKPHNKSEHIRLDFNTRNELDKETNTEFAPFRIHREIVKLLHMIEPFMAELVVTDDSGLWQTGDEAAAREEFARLGGIVETPAEELAAEGEEVDSPSGMYDLASDEDDDGSDDDSSSHKQPYG